MRLLKLLDDNKSILLIIVFGLLVYFNSLFNGYTLDDDFQIFANPPVQSIANISSFFQGSTYQINQQGELSGYYYKPLLTTAFSLIYTLFGPNTFYFHFIQVSLHIVSAILLFIFLRYFFKTWNSFFLALIFSIHPINVESVAYISALQEPMYLFFGLLALIVIQLNDKKLSLTAYPFLILLAILSKEAGFYMMLMVLLFLFLFKKNRLKIYLILSIFPIALYSWLRFGLAKIFFDLYPLNEMAHASFYEKLITFPKIIFFYLKTFFFPKDLIYLQRWSVREININDFYLPLFFITVFFLIVIFLSVRIYKKDKQHFKTFLFFFLWLVFGLIMHSQIFHALNATVSDRWFYFSMIGLLGIFGTIFKSINLKHKKLNYLIFFIALLIIVGLSLRTINRNFDWKDHYTLLSHDVKYIEESYELEFNLGIILLNEEKTDQAEAYFKKSVKTSPKWFYLGWLNLWDLYQKQGRYKEAEFARQKAIEYGMFTQ